MCGSTEYDDLLVCKEGRHISCTSVNLISAKGRRRLGLNELACKMSCLAPISNATTSDETMYNNVGLDVDIRPKCERANPPFRDVIPENLEYLRRFGMDSAYVDEQGLTESKRAYKRRAYNTSYHVSRGETDIQDVRISKIWPNTHWNTVWKNIHCTPVPGGKKAAWYKVTHDILPTNVRLHKIRISPTDKCNNCGMHDTLQHRLIECGEGPQIWQWTTQKLDLILRTIPTKIPSEWLLRPHCALWPPTRRRGVMWILANVVLYRAQPNQELTLRDFIAFMQAYKYKLYQRVKRRLLVANYFCVLDMP